jgi:anti-anti-sigma factor
MQIGTRTIGSVTVWSLAGRLDASGAGAFDLQIVALAPDCRWLALDMNGVPFMSSLGIRSLLRLHRRVREGDGALALCGVQPFVQDVLYVADLTDHLTMAASLEEGVLHLEAACAAADNCETMTLRGCAIHVRTLPVAETEGAVWRTADRPGTPYLAAVHLDELGTAFGTGGFGVNRAEAAGELGLFLSTGRAVVLCPADGRNMPDLLISTRPERTLLYVREGVGLPASPSHAVEAPGFEGTLAEMLEALPGCPGSATSGVVMLAERMPSPAATTGLPSTWSGTTGVGGKRAETTPCSCLAA